VATLAGVIRPAPMSRHLFIVLYLLCLLLQNTLPQPASAENRPLLRVAVLRDFPPQYSTTVDGKPQGYAVDVIRKVAALAGAELQFVAMDSWQEMFDAVLSGEADLIPNQGITAERRKQFAFTVPVETFPIRIFVRRSSDAIHSLVDLAGKKIGVVRLNAGARLLEQRRDLNVILYDHVKDAFFDLLAGGLDAIVFPEPVLRLLARRFRLEDRITTVGPPLLEIKRAISVRRDNTELLERLDRAAHRFVGSPAHEEIYSRWYGTPAPLLTTRQWISLLAALLAMITGGMALWRYRELQKDRVRLETHVSERTASLETANRRLASAVERRGRAEEQLREKEHFLTSILDAIQDGICVLDPDLTIVRTNTTMQHLYRDQVPLEGKTCHQIFHKRADPCVPCPCLATLQSGRIEREEILLLSGEETTGTLEVFAFPIVDDEGAITGVVEYVRDISQRKKAEQALADSRRRLADMIEFLPDATWVIDSDGRVIAWNQAMELLTGINKEEMLGKGGHAYAVPLYGKPRPVLIDLVLERQRDWEKEYLSIRKESGGHRLSSESFHPGLGENGLFLAGTAARLYDAQGRVVGAIESLRDITHARRAEQEREHLIEELKAALEKVQTLSGLLPICASCKKIRDDKGYWNQIETYISNYSEAEFSHSICPDCAKELYPGIDHSKLK
jgi:PAS domain S-box-containing protein